MGKIALTAKPKKADDDVEGLVKPSAHTPPPSKTAPAVTQHPSPTPKHPLPLSKTKAGCCRRTCLFSLGVSVVLILFLSTACLVDYQQGNLATHTSQLPKEVREFPRQVGKYMVEVLTQTPKDLHRLYEEALNWTKKKKNGSDATTSKGKLGSQKMVLTDEIVLDESNDEIVLDESNAELSTLQGKEGNEDTVVVDGLQGVAQFFVDILKDVTSVFTSTMEEEFRDSETTPPGTEITNNAIDRKVVVEEPSGRFEMTQPGAHADQVHSPEFFEHTTENKDDWNNEVIEVMEEISPYEGTTKILSDKESLKNLLDNKDREKQHSH